MTEGYAGPFDRPTMASTTTSTGGDLDQWIEIAKNCKYLPENDLKVQPDFFFQISFFENFVLYTTRNFVILFAICSWRNRMFSQFLHQ